MIEHSTSDAQPRKMPALLGERFIHRRFTPAARMCMLLRGPLPKVPRRL